MIVVFKSLSRDKRWLDICRTVPVPRKLFCTGLLLNFARTCFFYYKLIANTLIYLCNIYKFICHYKLIDWAYLCSQLRIRLFLHFMVMLRSLFSALCWEWGMHLACIRFDCFPSNMKSHFMPVLCLLAYVSYALPDWMFCCKSFVKSAV